MKQRSISLVPKAVAILLLFSMCMTYSVIAQNAVLSNEVPSIPLEKWDSYGQAVEKKNVSINFYGMVVDPNGNPLSDVNIVLRVQQIKFHPQYLVVPKYIRFDRTTASDGRFSLDGVSGRSVDIVSITKPGYEFEKGVNPVYGAVTGSAEKPIRLVLWENNRKNPMVSGDKEFEFIPGRTYALDLEKQTITQATNSEGDFQFRLMRPMGVGNWDKFDWSFDIKGQHGNVLQKTDEGYFGMVFSPESGYTNTYGEIYHVSDLPWKGQGEGRFYIKIKDGQEFGKFALIWASVDANAGPKTNKAGIHVQYSINPTGSPLVR